jgi:hypothetical protein
MKHRLRFISWLLAAGGLLAWLALGANPGWTKTSVPVKTVDAITGIEGIEYQKRFVPGLDLLGGVLLAAAALAAAAFFLPRPNQKQTQPANSNLNA